MILHLVLRRARRPTGRVGVSPLGRYHDLTRLDPPLLEPRCEKILRPSVRPRRIDVPDPGVVRGIENLVSMQLHARRIRTATEIGGVIQRHVSRPPQRG